MSPEFAKRMDDHLAAARETGMVPYSWSCEHKFLLPRGGESAWDWRGEEWHRVDLPEGETVLCGGYGSDCRSEGCLEWTASGWVCYHDDPDVGHVSSLGVRFYCDCCFERAAIGVGIPVERIFSEQARIARERAEAA